MRLLSILCALVLALPSFSLAQTRSSSEPTSSTPTTTTVKQAEPTRSTGMTSRTVTKTRTSKPMKGYVINLTTMKRVNTAEATAMTNKGSLALLVGSRAYYILKSDGTSAGDDLARLADAAVGVVGRSLTKNYISVVMADIVDTMK
jgi:cell division septation protein DedD